MANAPDLSFRGAKRRGNLLQPVTFSPRPTCYPTWYCEIATSAVGLLAMTKLTASRHKINAANNWRPAWRSQPAIGFHVLSPPCTSRQCLPEIATSAVGLLAMTHQGSARCTSALTRLNCPVQGAHNPQGARRSLSKKSLRTFFAKLLSELQNQIL